ncbi:MAG: RidA family protein [Gammaproteobacteria bacterium]|nr:RidA family protein [Gammaproteobacteria bacterium]
MKKTRVISPKVGEPPEGTWSNCLKIGDQIYVAGMTSRGGQFDDVPSGDAYTQAVTIFRKIADLMEQAGGTMNDLVKIVVYLTDIDDRDAVWKARREFFTEPFPVSTLFEVSRLVRPEMKVEIDAVGILGSSA